MIHFEIHEYSPEQNKAFIRGKELKGYTPKVGKYKDMLRALRAYLKPKKDVLAIHFYRTGYTKSLGKGTLYTRLEHKNNALKYLNTQSKGVTEKGESYGYKITKVEKVCSSPLFGNAFLIW